MAEAVEVQRDGSRLAISREWVPEAPVALEFNGLAYAVMMATPADLADFATGFALTEGLAAHAGEVTDLGVAEVELGWIVRAAAVGPRRAAAWRAGPRPGGGIELRAVRDRKSGGGGKAAAAGGGARGDSAGGDIRRTRRA